MRTLLLPVVSRYFEPVTVPVAPRNSVSSVAFPESILEYQLANDEKL